MTARYALPWLRPAQALAELSEREPTPIVSLCAVIDGRPITIGLKLESESRWGSVKDRTALGLVSSVVDLLEDPDAAIVESTSGNLGAALASIARILNRRFVAVVDPSLSPALAARMTAMGAELEYVSRPDDQGGYLDARLARVADLLAGTPGAVWTDQYHNPANPLAHYRSTAPELLGQAPHADAIFIAVSTGGTLAGISRYARQHASGVRIVAVDVPGSQVFAEPTGSRLLTGIGASRRSSFLRPGAYDDVILVDDARAITVGHQVRRATGLSLGGSSAAAVAACLEYARQHPEISAPVCLCPDDGRSYARTIYDAGWLASKSIDVTRWDMSAVILQVKENSHGRRVPGHPG
jgi:N-(2-amino-2-carboxyethyl)-L-glutamate synthase